MRRVILAALLVTSAASASLGSAAALGGISGGDVAAGDAAIAACDTTGFGVSYTTSGGAVTTVTVDGIADPACEGADLSVTLTDADGTSVASGGPVALAADGDTADNAVAVAVAPNPAAEQVRAYHVSIVGP